MFMNNNKPIAYKALQIIHIYWKSVNKNIQKKITGSTGLNVPTEWCKNALVQFVQLVSGEGRCMDSMCPSDVSRCTIQTVFIIMSNGVIAYGSLWGIWIYYFSFNFHTTNPWKVVHWGQSNSLQTCFYKFLDLSCWKCLLQQEIKIIISK